MEESFLKQIFKSILEFLHEYNFVFFSTLGVIGLRLKKKMKWYVLFSKMIFSFLLGMILFYSGKQLNVNPAITSGVIGVLCYMIDEIQKILLTIIKGIPKVLWSFVKGKLNLKDDCKIDNE